MTILYTLFNHTLTKLQIDDAKNSLGVSSISSMPENIKYLWSNIPADLENLEDFLMPVKAYIQSLIKGNYILIQGDFGAVVLAVQWAKQAGLIPIYSTTKRVHKETLKDDGSVEMIKSFKHCRYRRY